MLALGNVMYIRYRKTRRAKTMKAQIQAEQIDMLSSDFYNNINAMLHKINTTQ